ncbi:response regulator [Prosthecodimorpha staleyi]|uniref:Response regulator n=1 Tax=Prosthecodimorpha staleyi TaxID=2840188 RepID=A0A947D4K4_9HYPH|nr:response regulator [Prosthecodimorpha staleyi]MBT9290908.1 response regulator [Prosthecodimorpha staleyi]
MIEARSKLVLVLEDEPIVAMLIEDMLNELGWRQVTLVDDIKEALDVARASEIAFAILDINIDGIRSTVVSDDLRHRGIPFIVATGYGPGAIDDFGRDVPALQKPFIVQELQAAITRIMPSADV